jgi:hypothetical protein
MNPSRAYDPTLHADGSVAASGGCSYHQQGGHDHGTCTGEAVVSFQDADGEWHSGCAAALRELVAAGRIEPFGQGA